MSWIIGMGSGVSARGRAMTALSRSISSSGSNGLVT